MAKIVVIKYHINFTLLYIFTCRLLSTVYAAKGQLVRYAAAASKSYMSKAEVSRATSRFFWKHRNIQRLFKTIVEHIPHGRGFLLKLLL